MLARPQPTVPAPAATAKTLRPDHPEVLLESTGRDAAGSAPGRRDVVAKPCRTLVLLEPRPNKARAQHLDDMIMHDELTLVFKSS